MSSTLQLPDVNRWAPGRVSDFLAAIDALNTPLDEVEGGDQVSLKAFMMLQKISKEITEAREAGDA
jgi:hypothetical protein